VLLYVFFGEYGTKWVKWQLDLEFVLWKRHSLPPTAARFRSEPEQKKLKTLRSTRRRICTVPVVHVLCVGSLGRIVYLRTVCRVSTWS
jgi:hypothetical protein